MNTQIDHFNELCNKVNDIEKNAKFRLNIKRQLRGKNIEFYVNAPTKELIKLNLPNIELINI